MKINMFQKIVIAGCLAFFTIYLPASCEARSDEGEVFVQLRNGEGRIEQIDTEGVTIDDLYFRFSENTRYLDLNDQDTQQGYLAKGMYVSFIINLDETVNRIQSMARDASQEEEAAKKQAVPGPSGGDTLYKEGGVWKN